MTDREYDERTVGRLVDLMIAGELLDANGGGALDVLNAESPSFRGAHAELCDIADRVSPELALLIAQGVFEMRESVNDYGNMRCYAIVESLFRRDLLAETELREMLQDNCTAEEWDINAPCQVCVECDESSDELDPDTMLCPDCASARDDEGGDA